MHFHLHLSAFNNTGLEMLLQLSPEVAVKKKIIVQTKQNVKRFSTNLQASLKARPE